MRKHIIAAITLIASVTTLSSKDKGGKVPFHEMAVGMRDAFNCGVLVEEYRHGSLKGNDDAYKQGQTENHCDHVETILNTLQPE